MKVIRGIILVARDIDRIVNNLIDFMRIFNSGEPGNREVLLKYENYTKKKYSSS